MNKRFIALFGLLSLSIVGYAQRWQASEFQSWFDVNPNYAFANGLTVYGDAGYRTNSPQTLHRLVVRGGIKFRPFKPERHASPFVQSVTFHAGLGDFYTHALKDTAHINEFRPYQGVEAVWPKFQRWQLSHYLRFEERFLHYSSYQTSSFRTRYLLTNKFSFKKASLQAFYVPVACEIFVSMEQYFSFKMMRTFAGVGWKPTAAQKVELLFYYQWDQLGLSGVQYSYDKRVLRLRYFYSF